MLVQISLYLIQLLLTSSFVMVVRRKLFFLLCSSVSIEPLLNLNGRLSYRALAHSARSRVLQKCSLCVNIRLVLLKVSRIIGYA